MKRLSKRDNVSSILKRRATTIMMAATVIGAVGLSSTLVSADSGEDLSLKGTEITIGNGKATVSDSGSNGNYGISTESQNGNTSRTRNNNFGVELGSGEKINRETVEKESLDKEPRNDEFKVEHSPASPFITMENRTNKPGSEKENKDDVVKETIKEEKRDLFTKNDRSYIIGEKINRFGSRTERVRTIVERIERTIVERIIEDNPLLGGITGGLPGLKGETNQPGERGLGGITGGLPGLKGETNQPGERGLGGITGGLPGLKGETNQPGERGLGGITGRLPGLKGETNQAGEKGLGGITGRLPGLKGETNQAGERGLGGKNNGLEGIEGGNSGNNEINNNSTKNNYPRGGWDLESIKPLIERDSDEYRSIYEKRNHCRRICDPCRRQNPRIIFLSMNSGRRCLPRMSHTRPSFGINGFLGSIMLYLSAKVR
ncbi:MAG: hypothetical protein SPG13_06365 [Peptostreptococcus porci]|uniref:hypothetical protein n=1 Tax=Peptostreptococcus porci TaxID=2652282 RepID=UPI002A91FA34|nr:hypothetical protein [Peptostreptococcus porci]MDY5480075.1 hypothetical protein [Peptostreptococcus porci]